MPFELLECVVLRRDLPAYGLRKGDLGTIVEVHGPDAFEVEFVSASGSTQALLSLAGTDVRKVEPTDIVAVRQLAG